MHFIFPKNYDFKPKLLGFIEYSTAIIDAILGIVIYSIINLLLTDLDLKLYFFIALFFPILIISIIGINHENFISVFLYIFKFFKNRKVYLYNK